MKMTRMLLAAAVASGGRKPYGKAHSLLNTETGKIP